MKRQPPARRVYFIKPVGMPGPVKIGCSIAVDRRVNAVSQWSPYELEVMASVPGDFRVEGQFHRMFLASHSRQEWFHATGDLLDVIAAISAGTFDMNSLPPYAGKLNGMVKRLRAYDAIDFEYLVTIEDYYHRPKDAGWYQGRTPPPCQFVKMKDHDDKARVLANLRRWMLDAMPPRKPIAEQSSNLALSPGVGV